MYDQPNQTLVSFFAHTRLKFSPSPVIVVTSPLDLSTIIYPTSTLVIDLLDSFTNDGITVGEGIWEWEWDWDCFIPREGEGRGGGGLCMYEGGGVVDMPGSGEGRFVGGGREGEVFQVGVPLYFVVRVRIRERLEGGVLGEVVTDGKFEKVFSVVEGEGVQDDESSVLVIEENQWICDDGAIGYSVCFFFFHLIFVFFTNIFIFLRSRFFRPTRSIIQSFQPYGRR